jgi:hypothetical protein
MRFRAGSFLLDKKGKIFCRRFFADGRGSGKAKIEMQRKRKAIPPFAKARRMGRIG